jgi:sortase A
MSSGNASALSRGPRSRWTGGSHKRSGRRLSRAISTLLILAGLLLLGDVVATLVWQEPVTALVGLIERSDTDTRFLSYRTMPLSAAQRAELSRLATAEERVAYLARQEQRSVPNGAAVGRLQIARLGVVYDVVQGTATGDLERGPGHYARTGLPGEGRTIAIAGHRTTYLAPFRNLNELHRGDRIVLRMPYGTFTYVVQSQRIVSPNAWWITRNVGYERLVLSACNPLYSASQRIAVFARLLRVHPNARAGAQFTGTWTVG